MPLKPMKEPSVSVELDFSLLHFYITSINSNLTILSFLLAITTFLSQSLSKSFSAGSPGKVPESHGRQKFLFPLLSLDPTILLTGKLGSPVEVFILVNKRI